MLHFVLHATLVCDESQSRSQVLGRVVLGRECDAALRRRGAGYGTRTVGEAVDNTTPVCLLGNDFGGSK
jgi:hypothetical protein